MASERLFELLAEALGQKSRSLRAVEAAAEIPFAAMQGYDQGAAFGDRIRKRKQDRQTLEEIVGGPIEGLAPNLQNLPFGRLKDVGDALGGLSKFTANPTHDIAAKRQFAIEQQARQIAAADKRQKDRQNFIRDMVGAKGNRDAVNQAKNAAQGIGYVDELWDQMEGMSTLKQAAAGTPGLEKAFPMINSLKQNVLRTAGFAEGGKAFTGTERAIIVDSFLPTTYETPQSKKLKRQIARDYYGGTIDLFEAARLLGPAGAKIQAIAEAQRKRHSMGQSMLNEEAGTLENPGGNDLDDIFSSEGVQ